MKLSVAIDGPAGAGKSTIAKLLAKRFNLMYINTGAMYRAVTLKAIENSILPTDTERLEQIIEDMDMEFINDDLYLNKENIQSKITMPQISSAVSEFAAIPEVRIKLVDRQRKMSEKYDVIMDGRDIGTVVLKDARVKIFLNATPEERSKRRYEELINRGILCEYDKIFNEIVERDYKDSNRKINPLMKAKDAIEVDTTGLDIASVTDKIAFHINNIM